MIEKTKVDAEFSEFADFVTQAIYNDGRVLIKSLEAAQFLSQLDWQAALNTEVNRASSFNHALEQLIRLPITSWPHPGLGSNVHGFRDAITLIERVVGQAAEAESDREEADGEFRVTVIAAVRERYQYLADYHTIIHAKALEYRLASIIATSGFITKIHHVVRVWRNGLRNKVSEQTQSGESVFKTPSRNLPKR